MNIEGKTYIVHRIRKRQLVNLLFTICLLSYCIGLMTSCSMMKEDRSDCPDCRNPLRIRLRYDYNTQRANMFADHVKQATVYVVDPETGTVVDWQTVSNTVLSSPLCNPQFSFNFEGLTPGNYRLYATGCSVAETAYQITRPEIAQPINQLQFTVPTDPCGNVPAQRLDTLWNTLNPIDVEVPESSPTEAVIGLMRLTNDLNVMVFRYDHATDIRHEHYDVLVTDEHPVLGHDNAPASGPTPITYHPFACWTTETIADNVVVERSAHYDLSLSRLLTHEDNRHNPRLIIRNRETSHEIINIDLCHFLSLARNAYEIQNYSGQEYLDREYDYRIDFGIDGEGPKETWKYMNIRINLLSWVLRIQNEEL